MRPRQVFRPILPEPAACCACTGAAKARPRKAAGHRLRRRRLRIPPRSDHFEGRKWPEGRAETVSFGGENGHFRSNSSDGGARSSGGSPPPRASWQSEEQWISSHQNGETGGRRLTHHHASAHQAARATRGRGQTHTPRRTPTDKPPSPPCASGSCIGGFGLVALLFLFEQLLVFRVGRDDSEFFAFESVGIALGIASAVCLGVVSALGGMGELR